METLFRTGPIGELNRHFQPIFILVTIKTNAPNWSRQELKASFRRVLSFRQPGMDRPLAAWAMDSSLLYSEPQLVPAARDNFLLGTGKGRLACDDRYHDQGKQEPLENSLSRNCRLYFAFGLAERRNSHLRLVIDRDESMIGGKEPRFSAYGKCCGHGDDRDPVFEWIARP